MIPFYVPLCGPGLHQSMIFQFANLTTKQILFGLYVSGINEILKIKYRQDMIITYYDAEHSKKEFAERTNATTTSKVSHIT